MAVALISSRLPSTRISPYAAESTHERALKPSASRNRSQQQGRSTTGAGSGTCSWTAYTYTQGVRSMVQLKPSLVRQFAQASTHCRRLHSRATQHDGSIAHLLDSGPANASNVVVNGFIRSIRSQKHVSFADVGDGSSLKPLQAILTHEQAQRSEATLHQKSRSSADHVSAIV